MTARRFSVAVLCAACFGLLSASAEAQRNKQREERKPKPQTIDGTMKGVKGTTVLVAVEMGGYIVSVPAAAQVTVVGEADAGVLKPGMFVRFTAPFNEEGVATEPLKEISTFTPSEADGIGAQEVAGGVFISGRLKSLNKAGEIAVDIKGKTAKAELSPDVKVELGSHLPGGYRLAKDGDRVVATGVVGQPPMGRVPGTMLAQKLEITLSQPVSTGVKITPKEDKDSPKTEPSEEPTEETKPEE